MRVKKSEVEEVRTSNLAMNQLELTLESKRTASKGKGAASSSVPPVQSKSLGKNVSSHSTHWDDFKDKEVVCEKSVKLVDLSDYNVRSILDAIN